MSPATARAVYPVLLLGLDMRRRLLAGQVPPLDLERARLKDRLLAVDGGDAPEGGRPAAGTFLGPRYALACWLDEVFTRLPGWADRWNERKLEGELYGSNDRAWRFWDQARVAGQRPSDDAVTVFYLCVRLGFRGTQGEEPVLLAEWVEGTRARLGVVAAPPTPFDLEPDPAPDAPPRHGEAGFERMTAAVSLLLLAALPLAGFVAALSAGGR